MYTRKMRGVNLQPSGVRIPIVDGNIEVGNVIGHVMQICNFFKQPFGSIDCLGYLYPVNIYRLFGSFVVINSRVPITF